MEDVASRPWSCSSSLVFGGLHDFSRSFPFSLTNALKGALQVC